MKILNTFKTAIDNVEFFFLSFNLRIILILKSKDNIVLVFLISFSFSYKILPIQVFYEFKFISYIHEHDYLLKYNLNCSFKI